MYSTPYIILVSYRARGIQVFRRNQLMRLLENIKYYFSKHNIPYKIVISEQNNDMRFNRGFLLNVAFLESEKLFQDKKIYFHMNADYTIDISREFPSELFRMDENVGFLELYRPPHPVLGSACLFDPESYRKINGFPNDLEGWGGDDWAIYHRIQAQKIPIITIDDLCNSGFIIDEYNPRGVTDTSQNDKNMKLAMRTDWEINGLSSISYHLEGIYGEFHDGNIIFHFLVNDTTK
jgi:hypothetical protein